MADESVGEGYVEESVEGEPEEDFSDELRALATDAEGQPIAEGEEEKPPGPKAAEPAEDEGEGEEEADRDVEAEIARRTYGMRRDLEHTQAQLRTVTTRFNDLLKALGDREKAEEGPEPMPEFEEDPSAHIRRLVQDEVRPLVEAMKTDKEDRKEDEQREYVEDVEGWVSDDRDRFIEEHPDFGEAEKHLILAYAADIRAHQPDLTDEQIAEYLMYQVFAPRQIQYYNQNRSLAESVYEEAKRRGWAPQASNGEAAPKPSKTVEKVRRKVERARSLSDVPKVPGRKTPDSKEVLAMTDEEWDKYVDSFKDSEEALEKIAKRYAVEM